MCVCVACHACKGQPLVMQLPPEPVPMLADASWCVVRPWHVHWAVVCIKPLTVGMCVHACVRAHERHPAPTLTPHASAAPPASWHTPLCMPSAPAQAPHLDVCFKWDAGCVHAMCATCVFSGCAMCEQVAPGLFLCSPPANPVAYIPYECLVCFMSVD